MTGSPKVEGKYIGISTYVLFPRLLHPGILVAGDRGQLLVDVLESEPEAARVDLAVGEVELLGRFLVLHHGEVTVHDATCIIISHLPPRGVVGLRGFQGNDLGLQFKDQGGQFNKAHLDSSFLAHYNLRLSASELMHKITIPQYSYLVHHYIVMVCNRFNQTQWS